MWPALLMFVFGAAVRMTNFLDIFPGGGRVYLFEPDCYMRLRKVMVYLAAFPRPLVFDYFQGYPHGTGIISPPLMEYLLAALLFPFTGHVIAEQKLAALMAFIPPLAGGATVALLFILVRKWFGTASALVAALFLALLPIHIESTVLGRFDNEMMEPLMFVLVLFLYLRTFEEETLVNWLLLGVAQGVFLILWRGALVPLAVIGVDILFRACRQGRGRSNLHAAGSYLLPAALFAFICLTDVWGTRDSFSYNIISWFHVLLFALAGAAVMAAGLFASENRRVRYLSGGILAAACLALFPFLKPGLMVAAGGNDWIDSISQYLPAYRDGSTLYFYGIFPLVAPLVAWLWLRRDDRQLLPRRFFMLSLCYCFLLALLRRRFGHFYAVEAAIAAGFVPLLLRDRLGKSISASSAKTMLLSIAALLPLQLVTASVFPSLSSNTTGPIKGDLEQTFLWLRNNTPPAGDPYRPDRLPSYSVLTHWDLGGYLETIGQRPSVATSYGMETYGLEEAGRLFLSTDSSSLTEVLDRNRSKYMILYNPLDKFEMYTKLLKVENRFFVDKWDPKRGEYAYEPTPAALDLAVLRLFVADGSMVPLGNLTFKPIEGVRLVYESASPADLGGFPWQVSKAKVFERVPGARVVLPAVNGCKLVAEQSVITNQGREFVYRNLGKTEGGSMAVVLDYPPRKGVESTGAVGPARIYCGERRVILDISAAAVAEGKTLRLAW